jgi:hypothetical protein
MLDTGLEELARHILRDLGRLGQRSALGDEPWNVRARGQVPAACKGLDVEANQRLLDVLLQPASPAHLGILAPFWAQHPTPSTEPPFTTDDQESSGSAAWT